MEKEECFGIIPIYKADDPEYLIIQQKEGHWSFPKGHPEKNESPEETAKREFEEETGIRKYSFDQSIQFHDHYICVRKERKFNKTVTFFIAFIDNQKVTIQEGEITNYHWGTYSEVKERITYPGSKTVLDQVHQWMGKRLDS